MAKTDQNRIHRAISKDGTEIAGNIHGQGPPLVLFHGGLEDGDTGWKNLVPNLSDHFTCYLPSMRGRGLSADNPDLRPERHSEDIAAFVDSIGGPVGLMGESTGAFYSLGAVQRGAKVSAVALYESPVFEFWEEDGEDTTKFKNGVAGMAKAAAEGKLVDAVQAFCSGVYNDDEMAQLAQMNAFEPRAQFVPKLLQVLEQAPQTEGPNPNDPAELTKVTTPSLLLYGSRTTVPHAKSTKYLAEKIPNARLKEIPGAGHAAPSTAPEQLANELIQFFEENLRKA